MPYLDKTGLSHFWSNLKTLLEGKAPTSHNHSASQVTSGTLPVSRGGTGKSTITANNFLVGNGTSAMTEVAPSEVPAAIGISDYIVAEGTSGIWTWRKWNSGKAECWGTVSYSSSAMAAWGSSFEAGNGAYVAPAYPFSFVSQPVCVGEIAGNSSAAAWLCLDGAQMSGFNPMTTATPYNVMRATKSGSGSVTPKIQYYAIGKWK